MYCPSVVISLSLLAGVQAQLLQIPQVDQLVKSALNSVADYTDYQGPTGTAAATLSSATAVVKNLIPSLVATTDPSYWLADIKHQGIAAFNPNPSNYTVFRNVKDYGAKGKSLQHRGILPQDLTAGIGDGVTDDTAAINAAISAGGRFGPSSGQSSTTTPAIVYLPAGTYVISSSIIDYYFTQLIGNPNSIPVLKATAGFTGLGLIDGNQYQSNGNPGWIATNVFFRQIRNLKLDMTAIPASSAATGIHWPTGQASSIQNVHIVMSSASGTRHQGIFIENGEIYL